MTIITLTTDFGWRDSFVGVMKGVILGIDPTALLVDLTHDLPPQAIEAAAWVLADAVPYFPAGTVHLAVVDPGVGSDRNLVALRAGGQLFVAPDNGLLTRIMDLWPDFQARCLENPAIRSAQVSRTFHGRDILAPAAAHLARGISLVEVGPALSTPVRLVQPGPEIGPDRIRGLVVMVDRFGNLITDIPEAALSGFSGPDVEVIIGPMVIPGLSDFYGQVRPGAYLALIGSHNRLEIARYLGRAETAELTVGSMVLVRRPNSSTTTVPA